MKVKINRKTIVAYKGEIVTCPNGHEIGEIAYNLMKNSTMSVSGNEITNWRKNQETFPNEECKCSICGEYWFFNGSLYLKGIGWM